jgi:branched-chain amino acid transport system ATP-binding protein
MTELLLQTSRITKRFGGLLALDDVNYAVREGEVRGIMGPNGAGKTTFFNIITGELKPTSGRIDFRGEEITYLPPHRICQKGLSRTFQLTFVFPEMSVYDCVWVGVNARSKHPWRPFTRSKGLQELAEKTLEICELVGLSDRVHELATNLAYGEQKVLEMAMALSTEPAILLLDEPTQGVSPKETEDISKVIQRLSERMTIVLIEHSMDVVLQLCHQITVLSEGRVVVDGPPEQISKNEEVQRIYLGDIL